MEQATYTLTEVARMIGKKDTQTRTLAQLLESNGYPIERAMRGSIPVWRFDERAVEALRAIAALKEARRTDDTIRQRVGALLATRDIPRDSSAGPTATEDQPSPDTMAVALAVIPQALAHFDAQVGERLGSLEASLVGQLAEQRAEAQESARALLGAINEGFCQLQAENRALKEKVDALKKEASKGFLARLFGR